MGNVVIDAAGVSPDSLRVQNTSGNYVFSGGPISGSTILEKTGAGTLTLTNQNSYTGGTSILGGILAPDASGQIGPQSAITNNATFRILAGNHTVGDISGTGKTEILGGTLTVASIRQSTLLIASNAATVPEPAASLLLLAGALCLFARRPIF